MRTGPNFAWGLPVLFLIFFEFIPITARSQRNSVDYERIALHYLEDSLIGRVEILKNALIIPVKASIKTGYGSIKYFLHNKKLLDAPMSLLLDSLIEDQRIKDSNRPARTIVSNVFSPKTPFNGKLTNEIRMNSPVFRWIYYRNEFRSFFYVEIDADIGEGGRYCNIHCIIQMDKEGTVKGNYIFRECI